MVKQILPDLRQVLLHRDTVLAQLCLVADARQHEELRGVDRPAGEDHFLCGADGASHPVLLVLDSDGRGALEQNPGGLAPVRTVRFFRFSAGRR